MLDSVFIDELIQIIRAGLDFSATKPQNVDYELLKIVGEAHSIIPIIWYGLTRLGVEDKEMISLLPQKEKDIFLATKRKYMLGCIGNFFREADMGPGFGDIPLEVNDNIDIQKLYIVGNKNYGESNGIIYAHRFDSDYFDQTVEISEELIKDINQDEQEYGSHFVNLMEPIMSDTKHARVFTDNNKYISQDCRHLTQAGAQYYARVLKLDWLLE